MTQVADWFRRWCVLYGLMRGMDVMDKYTAFFYLNDLLGALRVIVPLSILAFLLAVLLVG